MRCVGLTTTGVPGRNASGTPAPGGDHVRDALVADDRCRVVAQPAQHLDVRSAQPRHLRGHQQLAGGGRVGGAQAQAYSARLPHQRLVGREVLRRAHAGTPAQAAIPAPARLSASPGPVTVMRRSSQSGVRSLVR